MRQPSAPTRGVARILNHCTLDVDLHIGATVDIPAATTQSAEIAVATRRTPGTYQLHDVLIEYQLTRPGPGQDLLSKRLRPLDDHPEWEETLRAYLRHHCDRRETAHELHLHPNSVDYRLSRVASTCGFDATDPAQRALAHAALCVRDLEIHRTRQRKTSPDPYPDPAPRRTPCWRVFVPSWRKSTINRKQGVR